MLVTDIEITQYQYCAGSARHKANVCLTLKDKIITLFCQLDLPADATPRARSNALVSDAIRQMRRMPELRSGHATLHFADNLGERPSPRMA